MSSTSSGKNTAEPGIYDSRGIANRVSCCNAAFILGSFPCHSRRELPSLVSKGPRASRGKDTSSAAVPAPLSTIIMKLPVKNAEERYQTASGLKPILGGA